MRSALTWIAGGVCWLLSQAAGAIGPDEVLKKLDQAEYGAQDAVTEMKVVLLDRGAVTSESKLRMLQKGTDKRLIQFLAPADVKGVGFLDEGADRMYVYLPAFHKVRRIAGHVKNENFAGTDFAYDDMSSKPYSNRIKPYQMTEDGDSYLIEGDIIDKDSQYAKVKIWVRKADFLCQRMEYFDATGTKIKELIRKDFRTVGKYTQSFWVELKDLRKDHSTQLIVEALKFDTGLTERSFSKRQLKRL